MFLGRHILDRARSFVFVLNFVKCDPVVVPPTQIIIIIIIIILYFPSKSIVSVSILYIFFILSTFLFLFHNSMHL